MSDRDLMTDEEFDARCLAMKVEVEVLRLELLRRMDPEAWTAATTK